MLARYAIPFFFLMGLVVAPAVVALLCRWLFSLRWRKAAGRGRRPHKAWRLVAAACAVAIWGAMAYGFFAGFRQLEVRHVTYTSADLPAAFDGYRIVHFSDAHVGTYSGSWQWMLQRAVDTINAQHPDLIAFTGDLQNLHPDEVARQQGLLRQLKAPDGVFSVLGNHDYPMYLATDDAAVRADFSRQTRQQERQLGWQLLLNEHRYIRRQHPAAAGDSLSAAGTDSICIAGMEDWGKAARMPHAGRVRKAMRGVPEGLFTVMLEHDPSAWREKILPYSHAQLTLSGHTHGGQVALFGWSPVALSYSEWAGMSYEGSRAICVSTGLGGLIPFRIGQPGEIVVITLKKKQP